MSVQKEIQKQQKLLMAAAHHIQHKIAIKCPQFQGGINRYHKTTQNSLNTSEYPMLQVFLWKMRIPRFWRNTCQIPTVQWLYFYLFSKVVLAFKGQFDQWRSPSLAEHQGILHSKYELANPLIPSHSCHKQVLHEHRPETIHILTILN